MKYSGEPYDKMGPSGIVQTIPTHPSADMPDILTLTVTNDQADRELTITELPSPGIGQNSRAFKGKAISEIVIREKIDNPLSSGTLKGSLTQDMVEIIFAKDSTMEVLRMSGPHADSATLQDPAKKAWAKLP